jgi:hypothetical protein
MTSEIFDEMVRVFIDPEDYKKRLVLATIIQKKSRLDEFEKINAKQFNIKLPEWLVRFLAIDKTGLNNKIQEKIYYGMIKK